MIAATDIAKFWARVDTTGDCWTWTGRLNEHGYGQTPFTSAGTRKAHRVSWMIHNGAIADGLCVCHRCDTPSCVNPAHLFLGTHLDNMRDMASKGRGAKTLATHCVHGHSLADAYIHVRAADGVRQRACRTCAAIRRQTRPTRARSEAAAGIKRRAQVIDLRSAS